MKTNVTIKDFQNYCNSLFLAVLEISENDSSFFAIVKAKKENIEMNFTQTEQVNKYCKVRLSKKDINNNLITNNFFNN